MVEENICYICRDEDSKEKLILSCQKCNTSYVHSNCLKQWVDVRGNEKCKICNTPYTKVGNKYFSPKTILYMETGAILLLIFLLALVFVYFVATLTWSVVTWTANHLYHTEIWEWKTKVLVILFILSPFHIIGKLYKSNIFILIGLCLDGIFDFVILSHPSTICFYILQTARCFRHQELKFRWFISLICLICIIKMLMEYWDGYFFIIGILELFAFIYIPIALFKNIQNDFVSRC